MPSLNFSRDGFSFCFLFFRPILLPESCIMGLRKYSSVSLLHYNAREKGKLMDRELRQWHPAYQAAIQIELENDRDALSFAEEYPLSKKPLQIDTLIVRKDRERQLKASIGRLFREHNIIEYKSPEDYFSVNDFYKLVGYAGLYQSESRVLEVPPEEITLTVVTNHYPVKLLRHLKEYFHSEVESPYPGIYYVTELMFPLQIVVLHQLRTDEYKWLSRLRGGLDVKADIEPLTREYRGKEKDPLYSSVMEMIVKANWERCEKEKGRIMCNALMELFADTLEEKTKEATKQALEQGMQKGLERGSGRVNRLTVELGKRGRIQDIIRGAEDPEYQEKLFMEFSLK